ncbi:hypothetical protein ACFQ1I_01265 [Kitasatospora arboriphila]
MQATDTTFDGVGQLIGMSVFIVLAPPSSGADIPPHALPSFHRFLAHFEPMRQLSDGARATCASTTGRMPPGPRLDHDGDRDGPRPGPRLCDDRLLRPQGLRWPVVEASA